MAKSDASVVSYGPQMVSLGRLLDGTTLAIFCLILSGAGLYAFGLFHAFVIAQKKKLGAFGVVISKAFPFKNDMYEYNFTHIILFAILIALMCLGHHRALEQQARKVEAEEKARMEKKKD